MKSSRKSFSTPRFQHATELSKAITELRKSHSMSKHALARRLGIMYRTVLRWEAGVTIPQSYLLRQLIPLAPEKLRHIFEDASGTTFEQASLDITQDAPGDEFKNEWMARPEKHLAEIHDAIQHRVRVLYLKSKNGDEKLARKLAAVMAHVLSVTD